VLHFDSTLDKEQPVGISDAAVPLSTSQAREILGPDCLTLEEVCGALNLAADAVPAHLRQIGDSVHFSAAELETARADGEILIFRLANDAAGPLTIQRFIERSPELFDPKLLTKVGYALRDEWGITLEPLAKTEWKGEVVQVGKHAAYLWCADGILESKAGAALLKNLEETGTTRNWATLEKIDALLKR